MPATARERAAQRLWQKPLEGVFYAPGQGVNWEGQHSPLYYLVMVLPYRLARTWPPGVRLLFLRLCSVTLACGSLVFWFRSIMLFESLNTRRFLLQAGLIVTFFPSLWYDLARLGNDSLAAFLFAGSFYYLLSMYTNGQKQMQDFFKLSLALGVGLLTKLFFLPLLLSAVFSSLWLSVRVTRLGLKPLLFRIAVLVGGSVLLGGWWFGFCYFHYGSLIVSHEAYKLQQIIHLPGDQLTNSQFLIEMTRALGGFVATFLWCGTWSWVRPPIYLYTCFIPLFTLTLWNLINFVRAQNQTEKHRLVLVALTLVAPLLLGFVHHMYLRVQLTGVGTGTGGYYLFFAWPIVGIGIAFVFETKERRMFKLALVFALALVSFFDVAGWWRLALVYSGIVEKVGTFQTGIGFLTPTIDNLTLVIDRLHALSFPQGAMIFYGVAFLLRLTLAAWTIFSFPCPDRNVQR
jgi:hypothetical protein